MISSHKKTMTLSAGVIVCRKHKSRWLFLLLRAYGYWDFPKGIVEPGEESLAAAIRETEEETTIRDLEFRWGYNYRDTGPYNNRSKIARYYIAETGTEQIKLPINPELGKPEHDAFKWVGEEEATRMIAPRVKSAFEWAVRTVKGLSKNKLTE